MNLNAWWSMDNMPRPNVLEKTDSSCPSRYQVLKLRGEWWDLIFKSLLQSQIWPFFFVFLRSLLVIFLLLWKISAQVCSPLFSWVLCFPGCCILIFWWIPNINLVLDVYLAKSSLCGLLHLIVFFMGQKFLVLWGHNCWFFGYNSWAKETPFKRLFSSHILYRELHMFYFRYLIVSGFRLVSLIYWKLIFVGNNRYSSKFIALHVKGTEQWIFHFPSNTCWRCLLSHCVCFRNFLSNVRWLTLCSYWHYPLLLIYMFGNFYIGSTRLVL